MWCLRGGCLRLREFLRLNLNLAIKRTQTRLDFIGTGWINTRDFSRMINLIFNDNYYSIQLFYSYSASRTFVVLSYQRLCPSFPP